MGEPDSRYSKEFKDEAIAQVINRGYAVREVARRIGVSEHSLYRWVHRARKLSEEFSGSGDLTAENARLKLEFKRVRQERDILRKAAAYFANQSERGTPS